MSKKRIRAKAAYDAGNCTLYTEKSASCVGRKYYVLPATAEAYEQMVEQVAKGIMTCWPGTRLHDVWYKEARAALRAIGITPPKKGQP